MKSSTSTGMRAGLSFVPPLYRSLRISAGALLFAALTSACGDSGRSASDDSGASITTGGGGSGTGTGGSGGTGAGASSGGASGSSGSGTGGMAAGTGGMMVGTGGSSTGGAPQATATCMGSFESVAVDGMQHTVTVDSQASRGDLPHFWDTFGTGHLGLFLREDRGWGQTLQSHVRDAVQNLGLRSLRQHGLFHDDIGIYHEENDIPVYDFTQSDRIFDFFVEEGIEPIVELAPMPRDLAADPSMTVFDWNMIISPPKDFTRWQDLVYEFVRHSVDRYGEDVVNRWYFEVWNEPECCRGKFWSGTIDQYFELYDHSAAGVRRALPTGRVGGPVNSQPIELTDNSMLGQRFLDHVTTDNYINPGQPGVLDFFSYHAWNFVDGSVNGYFQGLDLLDGYGLNNVPIAITEFGPTYEFGLADEPQEMDQGAAFAVQTYSDIVQRCTQDNRRLPIAYSWWVLSDIFEEGMYREDDPFIGCMGLTSRENIHKPVYNAYKFLAQLGTQQVTLSVSGSGGVGGMAARSTDGGVQLIVYNGQNPGGGPVDGQYYNVADAHSIGVTVSGLDPEFPFDVTAYRVDRVNGNAYAAWQGLGRPAMSAMTDADWQALRDVMDSPAEPLARSVCGTTFTHAFQLESPGVLFVKLAPAAP